MYGVYLCVYQTSAYCSEKLKYVHTNFVCQVFNNEKTKRTNSKKLSHLNLEKSGNIPAQIKEPIVVYILNNRKLASLFPHWRVQSISVRIPWFKKYIILLIWRKNLYWRQSRCYYTKFTRGKIPLLDPKYIHLSSFPVA